MIGVRSRSRPVAAVAIALTVVLIAGIAGSVVWFVSWGAQVLGPHPPRVGTTIIAPADSRAAQAAAGGASAAGRAAAEYLAAQPTFYWLTPEQDPEEQVQERIAGLAAQARKDEAALAVAVYGLPGRDCGQFSAGGLDEPDYEAWTERIGQSLRDAVDVQKIVVLEPDSLALAPECGNVDERVRQLRGAIDRLAGPDTWIYVDGGHSNWVPADEMAALIAGLDRQGDIRGFATNVSNYNDSVDEFAYAHDVARALGGGHALIDTSRNGAGATSEWCNPSGRLVGERGGSLGDDVVDTNLWIKPPGESDGTCNGGPVAGEWWPEAAIELTRDVR